MPAGIHGYLYDALLQALDEHGEGAVHMILHGLHRAHALRTEATRHGLFIEVMYRRSASEARVARRTLNLDLLIPSRRPRLPPQPSTPPPSPPFCANAHFGSICSGRDSISTGIAKEFNHNNDWAMFGQEPQGEAESIGIGSIAPHVNSIDNLHMERCCMTHEDVLSAEYRFQDKLREQRELEECINAVGVWMPLTAELAPGDIVKTNSEVETIDRLRIKLDEGLCGRVMKIDNDGDALIQFPRVPVLGLSSRWIEKDCFRDLVVKDDSDCNSEGGQHLGGNEFGVDAVRREFKELFAEMRKELASEFASMSKSSSNTDLQ